MVCTLHKCTLCMGAIMMMIIVMVMMITPTIHHHHDHHYNTQALAAPFKRGFECMSGGTGALSTLCLNCWQNIIAERILQSAVCNVHCAEMCSMLCPVCAFAMCIVHCTMCCVWTVAYHVQYVLCPLFIVQLCNP